MPVVAKRLDELRYHLVGPMEVGLGPDGFVLDGDPGPPREKGHSLSPNFCPMSIVAKRLDG